MAKSVTEILAERQKTHGSFEAYAGNAFALKAVMHNSQNWPILNKAQKEALDMIAGKLARILSGDPNTQDHWDDCAGYATLGSKACESETE